MYIGEIDKEILLGVLVEMNTEEKQSHISKEYQKWNNRVTNKDPKIRRQAELMIHAIAELRKEYK